MNKYFIVILLFCTSLFSNNLKPITLQLQWKYQFQFAGFIMAKEKGYFKDIGLDVNLQEYTNDIDVLEDLFSKKTEYAIFNSQLIYKNKKMQKLRLLASYIQKNPLIFITQPEIKTPYDLNNKVIMGTNANMKTSALSQMLDHFFIDSSNSIFVPHSFSLNEFIDKKIDAMSVFRSNELFELDKRKIPYNILDPYDYGFFTSAINLFTSDRYAKENKEEVQNFILASNKGWKYALENIDETISLIHKKYQSYKNIEQLKYEAKITKELMLRNLYEIGEINKEQVLRQYKQLLKKELLEDESINRIFFSDLLNQVSLLSISEINYIKNKKTITYCVEKKSLNNKIFKGIEDDYIKLFSKKTGLKTNIIYTKDMDESLNYIQNQKCDLLPMVMKSKKTVNHLLHTTGYASFPMVIGTKSDARYISSIDNITNKSLGMKKNSPFIDILKFNYPGITLVEFDSLEEAFRKIQNNELFGVVDSLPILSNIIQDQYFTTMKISGQFDQENLLSIGVNKSDIKLHSILEKIVNNISEKEKQDISNKWISVKYIKGFDQESLFKIVIGILFLIIIFAYYYDKLFKLNYNLKNKNEIIKTKNTQMSSLLKEKDDLYKETYHRIKNNFQAIISILWIETLKKENKTSRPLIENICKRLVSLSKVHELLNNNTNNEKIILRNYIDELAKNLKEGLSLENIDFRLLVDSIDLDNKDIMSLGLIINELVTNSSKYAFEESNGKITIKIKQKENHILFVYKDSGKGFDQENQYDSLGADLINKFVGLLEGGDLKISSKGKLKYTIRFNQTSKI